MSEKQGQRRRQRSRQRVGSPLAIFIAFVLFIASIAVVVAMGFYLVRYHFQRNDVVATQDVIYATNNAVATFVAGTVTAKAPTATPIQTATLIPTADNSLVITEIPTATATVSGQ